MTDAGKKYIVEEPTKLRADLLKLFKANKDYQEPIPEYMSAHDNAFGARDAAVPVVEEDVVEEVVDVVAETPEAPVEEAAPATGADPNARYNALVAKTNASSQYMLMGRYKIVDVTQVLCSEDMFKAGRGSCVVLYKFVDKTPFGYVLNAPAEGKLLEENVNFVLYQDLGWTVASK